MAPASSIPSKYKRPSQGWRTFSVISTLCAIVLALIYTFHLRPFGLVLVDITYLYLLIMFFLPLCFLHVPASQKTPKEKVPWYDVVLIVLSIAAPAYFVVYEYEVLALGWEAGAPTIPWLISIVLWAVVLESGRRSGGPSFAIIILFFSVYPIFPALFPVSYGPQVPLFTIWRATTPSVKRTSWGYPYMFLVGCFLVL
jgi:TRAP-type uncharacterized transport system fused permease subunit